MTGAVRHAARAAWARRRSWRPWSRWGWPAAAAAAGLAVLLLAATCWVLASQHRSDHLARILLGLRGDARCLHPVDSPGPRALQSAAPGSSAAPDASTAAAAADLSPELARLIGMGR